MKTALVILLTSLSMMAQANPRLCNSYGATGETLRTAAAQYRYIDICRFGTAGIEALALDQYAKYQNGVHIVRKYIDNQSYWPKDCTSSGGRVITALDATNNKVKLCEFFDGSIMEARTFELGVEAPENMRMNQILGIE